MELQKDKNGNLWADARELHKELGIKKLFPTWIKTQIERTGIIENSDFIPLKEESSIGRPSINYLLSRDASLSVAMMSGGKLAKEVRTELINLFNQRENLELVTVKEAVFATRVVNCLKYIVNQKKALQLHSSDYFKGNEKPTNQQFAEFNTYRSKIVGWNKEKVNMAIDEYLQTHSGHNRNALLKSNIQTQLSVIDIGEAIRVAVLDVLYSNSENEYDAAKFSALCKRIANEMEVQPEKENKPNLFRDKEVIDSVNDIKLLK